MFVWVAFVNAKSAEVEMLLAVSAPQFRDPVTTVGPVIVVFVALTTKAFVPLVIDGPLVPASTPPQFNDPVTTVGPVIVVFVALTTTAFVPAVTPKPPFTIRVPCTETYEGPTSRLFVPLVAKKVLETITPDSVALIVSLPAASTIATSLLGLVLNLVSPVTYIYRH